MTYTDLPDSLRRALHDQIQGRAESSPRDLKHDALTMSVNQNLLDVLTLLQWAHDATHAEDKLGHVRQAAAVLRDVEGQLGDLSNARRE